LPTSNRGGNCVSLFLFLSHKSIVNLGVSSYLAGGYSESGGQAQLGVVSCKAESLRNARARPHIVDIVSKYVFDEELGGSMTH
jgi:hypothetical protein